MLEASMAMESMRNAAQVNSYQGNLIDMSRARAQAVSSGMSLEQAVAFDKYDSFNRQKTDTMMRLAQSNQDALSAATSKPSKGVNYVA